MDIAVALLVVVLVGFWVRRSTAAAVELRRRRESFAARSVPRPVAPEAGTEGIWARHPLDPERGWCVATNGGVPVDPGDVVRVRRKDGSRSLETVKRVVLELHEPDGDVVGRLVEVEEA